MHQTPAPMSRIVLLAVVAAAAVAPSTAFSQTETVLYSFNQSGPDNGPANPMGKLLLNAGNLIGTTELGGAKGHGTLYQLSAAGVLTILHDFGSPDIDPTSGVTADAAGNLYGSTPGSRFSTGSVYRWTPKGQEQTLGVMYPGPVEPGGEPLIDLQGELALTSATGGAANDGTVFTVSATGALTVLYSFTGAGGSLPAPGKLAMDPAGNFYGTTLNDTQTGHFGTVFKVTPAGVHTVLYDFSTNPLNYFGPMGGLLLDKVGNLYGAAMNGPGFEGCIYKLSAAGVFTVIYNFTADNHGGVMPNGGLIADTAGNLYGTTSAGGIGYGTVFELTPAGVETTLYAFGAGGDAGDPNYGVVMDAAGTLYGVAAGGAYGDGAIYKITR